MVPFSYRDKVANTEQWLINRTDQLYPALKLIHTREVKISDDVIKMLDRLAEDIKTAICSGGSNRPGV